jgi:hypothetical protein
MNHGGSRSGAGRPKGASNKATAELQDMARHHGASATEQLAHLMTHATSEAAQVAAARELLDRGYGRPTQAITGDPDGAPIALAIYTGVERDEPDEDEMNHDH